MALIEFASVFASEVVWIFFRKTGQSVFDAFGIALITALFLYFVQHDLSE
jgi:Mn2+/Fe2+ NRAMP family transporter